MGRLHYGFQLRGNECMLGYGVAKQMRDGLDGSSTLLYCYQRLLNCYQRLLYCYQRLNKDLIKIIAGNTTFSIHSCDFIISKFMMYYFH